MLIAGFPCKSLSPLTTTPGSVLDNGCVSGRGCMSLLKYVERWKPPLLLIENVRSLFHRRKVEEDGMSAQLVCTQH